uniref:Uncharacterized protein n=1 Tax=Anguilla anguilla TaxID=7936 RepID=A0A0E9WDN8_ANGAN
MKTQRGLLQPFLLRVYPSRVTLLITRHLKTGFAFHSNCSFFPECGTPSCVNCDLLLARITNVPSNQNAENKT